MTLAAVRDLTPELLLRDAVFELLRGRPGLSARECAFALRSSGVQVSKKEINQVLYRDVSFYHDGAYRPTWAVRGDAASLAAGRGPVNVMERAHRLVATSSRNELLAADNRFSQVSPPIGLRADKRQPMPPGNFGNLELRPWQREAFDQWFAAGRCGVVEAVTGTGKTRVGVAAAYDAVGRGERVVILVPSIALQNQWLDPLQRGMPDARIGRLGNGATPPADWDVLVAVINSAAADSSKAMVASAGLLIADECHRYGAPTFARALRTTHQARLGLTATYEREDEGLEKFLAPYFGQVVYQYDYERAVPEGVVAPFRVALVATQLTKPERAQYQEFTDALRQCRMRLSQHIDAQENFMLAVTRLAKSYSPTGRIAKRYLKLTRERLDLLARSQGKVDVVERLIPVLAQRQTLVFTEQKAVAENIARLCASRGLAAAALHSGHAVADRESALRRFRERSLTLLAAPRILDEGIDLPEAELGVVLAASKTRRQMVQRMGRVIRVKNDGRSAAFIIVFVADTVEDPADSAHAGFLAMITDVAQQYHRFAADGSVGDLIDFLREETVSPARVSSVVSVPVVEVPVVRRFAAAGQPADLTPSASATVAAVPWGSPTTAMNVLPPNQNLPKRRWFTRLRSGTAGAQHRTVVTSPSSDQYYDHDRGIEVVRRYSSDVHETRTVCTSCRVRFDAEGHCRCS